MCSLREDFVLTTSHLVDLTNIAHWQMCVHSLPQGCYVTVDTVMVEQRRW